jgi:hypothetical protein
MASSNAINILIAAKDQASSVIAGVAAGADKNMNSMAQSVETGLKRASVVMAGLGIGLTAYAKSANDYMVQNVTNAKNLARQTGDTVENASRLDYALQHMGISADQTSTVFNTFSKQIQKTNDQSADAALKHAQLANKIEATNEQITALTAEQKKNGDKSGDLQTKIEGLRLSVQGYQQDMSDLGTPLDDLNIKTKNADGSTKAFSDILFDVADKFKSMPDGVTKTNDALELFGKQGGAMVKILDKGSDGIKALMDQADKLGITITGKNIVAVDKYVQSQKNLTDSTNALKMQVGELTAPVMANFTTALNNVIQKFINSSGPMHGFLTYMLAFGGPIFSAGSGLAAFGSNLAGSLPLMAKFSKAAPALTAASGLEATGAAAAALPALINPVTVSIAAVAATAGIGYLAWKAYSKSVDDTSHSVTTSLPSWAGFATSMDIVTAAHQNQAHAEQAVADATANVTKLTNEHKTAMQDIAVKADSFTTAQNNVKNALDIYGASSPQYIQAVKDLNDKEIDLNKAKYDELVYNMKLTPANNDLAKARDDLTKATGNLDLAQDYLNNGLDGSLGRIGSFGPTAMAQVDSVATLQGTVATLAGTWDSFVGGFQSQSDFVSKQLEGNTYTAKNLQNTITNINKAAGVQFTGGAGNFQGAASISGKRAAGGPVQAGKSYLVGEKGEEIFKAPSSGTIIPADQTSEILNRGGGVTINQTNHIYSPFDMDAANSELGYRLTHA